MHVLFVAASQVPTSGAPGGSAGCLPVGGTASRRAGSDSKVPDGGFGGVGFCAGCACGGCPGFGGGGRHAPKKRKAPPEDEANPRPLCKNEGCGGLAAWRSDTGKYRAQCHDCKHKRKTGAAPTYALLDHNLITSWNILIGIACIHCIIIGLPPP